MQDWSKPGAPPVAGKEGSGHVWSDQDMPWLIAPNITPDKETGAGNWSDDTLARAIREGIGHDGRALVSRSCLIRIIARCRMKISLQ